MPARPGLEPATFGMRGKHAAPRPPDHVGKLSYAQFDYPTQSQYIAPDHPTTAKFDQTSKLQEVGITRLQSIIILHCITCLAG